MDIALTYAADGMVILFNGVISVLAAVAGPVAWLAAILIASLVWLATVEIDELDRMARKPTVGRH